MWREFFSFVKQIFVLTQRVDGHDEKVKELQRENEKLQDELHKLTMLVQKLVFDVQRIRESEQSEREKLALQLTIKLLEFERRLPPGPREE